MYRSQSRHLKRRTFVMGTMALGCAGVSSPREANTGTAQRPRPGPSSGSSGSTNEPARPEEAANAAQGIPRRKLGRTGRDVSMLGLGGYHIGIPSEKEAIAIMHRAIDEGMTFFDNCWDYHDGESERRMGKALGGGKRQKVFLMTKIDGRTKKAAADQLEDSLRRMKVDHIDLVQIHEVIREKDAKWVFGEDGAISALREAREAGKIGLIGFTGHKSPGIHLEMLRVAAKHDFLYDTVQMPINVMDAHFKSFQDRVLPVLKESGIGVLGMKAIGSGDILKSGVVSAEDCLRYALTLDTSVVITGCDSMEILDQALRVGRSFEPLSEAHMAELRDKTRPHGETGKLEAFKTTDRFDATARNPHWLTGGEV